MRNQNTPLTDQAELIDFLKNRIDKTNLSDFVAAINLLFSSEFNLNPLSFGLYQALNHVDDKLERYITDMEECLVDIIKKYSPIENNRDHIETITFLASSPASIESLGAILGVQVLYVQCVTAIEYDLSKKIFFQTSGENTAYQLVVLNNNVLEVVKIESLIGSVTDSIRLDLIHAEKIACMHLSKHRYYGELQNTILKVINDEIF